MANELVGRAPRVPSRATSSPGKSSKRLTRKRSLCPRANATTVRMATRLCSLPYASTSSDRWCANSQTVRSRTIRRASLRDSRSSSGCACSKKQNEPQDKPAGFGSRNACDHVVAGCDHLANSARLRDGRASLGSQRFSSNERSLFE